LAVRVRPRYHLNPYPPKGCGEAPGVRLGYKARVGRGSSHCTCPNRAGRSSGEPGRLVLEFARRPLLHRHRPIPERRFAVAIGGVKRTLRHLGLVRRDLNIACLNQTKSALLMPAAEAIYLLIYRVRDETSAAPVRP
jgi:hypothetical protein